MGLLRMATWLPWRVQLTIARGLGGLLRRLVPSRRHIAETNIALCFPQYDAAARDELVRRHFESLAISLFETAMSWWGSERRLRTLYHIEGLEHWQVLHAQGRGAILLYGHYTTLDLAGRFFAFHVPDVVPSYKPAHNPLFNAMMVRARQRNFGDLLPTDNMRALVREIRNGRLVTYSPDQDFGERHAVFAPFMGVPTATLTTTARLARITGAPVIPFYTERSADGRHYRIRLGPPLEGFPCGDEMQDAAAINASIEAQVRVAPEQYLWVHKRFKTRPAGEPSPYHTRV